MARLPRSLKGSAGRVALAVLVGLLVVVAPQARAASENQWLKPHLSNGKAFPVLRSAEGRWLNWRDTYGAPRMRLVEGTWRQVGTHQGIDVFSERGAPIVSITAGKVENVGWTFYSGFRVGIRGEDGRYYFYAHFSAFAPDISPGADVSAGQLLGRVGSSGYGPEPTQDEFPPHLHFGLQSGSRWLNPESMLRSLYEDSVAEGRSVEVERTQARQTLRRLKGRLAGVAAPNPMDLQKAITDTQRRLEALTTGRVITL